MTQTMLTPVLALVGWTFVMWIWMYATRIPAMRRARIDVHKVTRADIVALPVAHIADNYNHLHEQPTVFYALAFYSHLAGTVDATNATLAWVYVALRIVHSLVQATTNFVPLRFSIFVLASLTLMAIAARNALALCGT